MSGHLERLEDLYHSAKINHLLFQGSKMRLAHGHCEITLPMVPQYHHGMDAVHGAVFFKLLDDAAFFAAQTAENEYFIVTTGFNLHFLRPVQQGELKATGTLKLHATQLYIADAVLHDARGKEIAYGTGHFARSKSKLVQT